MQGELRHKENAKTTQKKKEKKKNISTVYHTTPPPKVRRPRLKHQTVAIHQYNFPPRDGLDG